MEVHPPLAPPEADETDVSRSQGATAFLAALGREHARFIDTLTSASSVLATSPGRLPPAAAAYARSTRQFLDAQRALLAMWADTDARLTRIVEATELDVALLGIELADCQPGTTPVPHPGPVTSDALDRPLRTVLDDWWRESNLHAAELVERCQARSSAVLHIARSQSPAAWAAPLVGTDVAVDCTPPITHLPARIADALDGADGSSVDAVLATLLQQLAEPDLPADPVPDHDDVAVTAERAVRGDRGDDRYVLAFAPDEAFERFWGAPRPRQVSPGRALIAHTLLPLGSFVGALILVLAWIG